MTSLKVQVKTAPLGLQIDTDAVFDEKKSDGVQWVINEDASIDIGGFRIGDVVAVSPLGGLKQSFDLSSLESKELILKSPKELEIVGELGQGACGVVRKAKHSVTGSFLALKTVRLQDNQKRRQFKEELEVLLQFRSPYIVEMCGTYASRKSPGMVTLALEYMEGGALDDYVKKNGPMSEKEIKQVAYCLTKAFELIHKPGPYQLIHRDVKPGNILLDGKGNAKLSDFGICKVLDGQESITRNCGTMHSPARTAGKAYSTKADIWGLGLSLLFAAAGKSYYDDQGDEDCELALAEAILNEDPPSLPANGDWSDAFRDFIRVMMLKDAGERWSAAELLSHEFLA